MKYSFLIIAIILCIRSLAQNVGIGTSMPAEKLHIVGNIKADTLKPAALRLTQDAAQGKVLVSDDKGNGTWQEAQSSGEQAGYGIWGGCDYNVFNYQSHQDSFVVANGNYGFNVAIAEEFAFAGNTSDTVGGIVNAGAVYVYKFDGKQWKYFQTLTHASPVTGDQFGNSIDASNGYVAIGCRLDDTVFANDNRGSVQVFKFNGTAWVFHQQLTHPTPASDDLFGSVVSISENFIAITVDNDTEGNPNNGSVQVFKLMGSTWTFDQGIGVATYINSDNFGDALDVSGNTLVIGASNDDETFVDQGSIFVLTYNGTDWIGIGKVVDSSPGTNDQFGYSVAVSDNMIAVGARFDDLTNVDQGSVVTFTLTNGIVTQKQKLSRPDGGMTDHFGFCLSASENYLLVGATFDDLATGADQGTATLYYKTGNKYRELEYIVDPDPANGDQLGFACDIDAATRRFVIGVPQYDSGKGMLVFGKVK